MPLTPAITTTVKITAKDINGNSTAEQFNNVYRLIQDYTKGTINIVDATGSFYFPLIPATSFSHTIVAASGGLAPSHIIVIS